MMNIPDAAAGSAGPKGREWEGGFLEELRSRAEMTPDAEVLLAPGAEPITFAQLMGKIAAFASAVADGGVASNEVVAVVMADGPEMLATILGVASVSICAPLNPALLRAEVEAGLSGLGARAIILDSTVDPLVREVAAALGIRVLDVSRVFPTKNFVESNGGSDIALVLQTSATTGKPRLVPLTHANLLAMATNTRTILALRAGDRFLSMMPLFHLQGLLSSLAQFLAGGSVVSTCGFDASRFVSWIEQFQPTWYTASPALHNAILPLMETRPDLVDRSPLRFVRSIGARLPLSLMTDLERVLRAPVLEGYGMTEAGMVTSNAPPPGKRKLGSVGQSGGVSVAIMGDTGRILAPGCAGEICVRGTSVIDGYLNNPAADGIAFRDRWFLSGDVGYLDEEGFLFVTGRIKDIINRGGDKVLPLEVDEALAAHPLVAEALAFAVPHPTLGEDVAAAVVLIRGASASEGELRAFAALRLAPFKVPRRIFFLDEIPKGPTGKSRRLELSERFSGAATRDEVGDVEPTPLERKLEIIWKRILRTEQIGAGDDFFAAGGDSLALTHLMAEMEFEFGADWTALDGSEFFLRPTIQTLAELLSNRSEGRGGVTRLPFVALQRHGPRTPFFCIPGADENPYYFGDLAKSLGHEQPFYSLRDPRPQESRGVYTVEEHAKHFVAAIRSVRPAGPYLLGGHCYGGILAFEAARQLIAEGEEVRLLALFEVPTPGYPKVVRHWRSYISQFMRLIRAYTRGDRYASAEEVRLHLQVLRGLMRRKARALTRRGLVSAGLQSVVAPAERMDFRNQYAGSSYEPKRLNCRVVQFIAADETHSTLVLDDPRLGWRDHVGAGFTVRRTPGKADAIFKPPYVGELASQLSGLLGMSDGR